MGINRLLATQQLADDKQDALIRLREDDDALDEVVEKARREKPTIFRAMAEDGEPRDWSGFFGALATFLQAIMPFIQMLIGLFSGVSIPTSVDQGMAGTASQADWLLSARNALLNARHQGCDAVLNQAEAEAVLSAITVRL